MTEFTRNWVLVYEEDEEVKYKEFDNTELALQFVSLAEVKFVALMRREYVNAMEAAMEDIANEVVVNVMELFRD